MSSQLNYPPPPYPSFPYTLNMAFYPELGTSNIFFSTRHHVMLATVALAYTAMFFSLFSRSVAISLLLHSSSWRSTSTPPPGGQPPLLLLAVNLHSSSWRTTLNPSWQSTSTNHDSLSNRANKYPVCVPSERNIRS